MKIVFLLPIILLHALVANTADVKDGLPWESRQAVQEKPNEIVGVGIQEKLGQKIDLSLLFTDDQGQIQTLGKYFNKNHPVILSPVYFSCPNLCNFHLNGLFEGLKKVDWEPGRDFEILAVSFDESESPKVSAPKKENYLKLYGRPQAASGIHFLTGSKESIQKLMSQVGFEFKWDKGSQQWSHASAAMIVTPDGVISRMLPGITFEGQNLRLALLEAGQGKIGTWVDKALLFCFHYDPSRRGYALHAFNIMRLGGGLTVLILGVFFFSFWRRGRKRTSQLITKKLNLTGQT